MWVDGGGGFKEPARACVPMAMCTSRNGGWEGEGRGVNSYEDSIIKA